MILPGKHIREDRALITVGAEILAVIEAPSSVSDVWNAVLHRRSLISTDNDAALPFDWFVLALSLLYAIGALDFDGERLFPRQAVAP